MDMECDELILPNSDRDSRVSQISFVTFSELDRLYLWFAYPHGSLVKLAMIPTTHSFEISPGAF
jgi:hypothetical protein